MSHISRQQAELLEAIEPEVLGARVRAAREARGWTQGELADGQVSVGYVSRIERGGRRPTPAVLARIAERLGLSLDDLLRDDRTQIRAEVELGLRYAELALESGQAVDAARQLRGHLATAESLGLTDLVEPARLLLARSLEATGELDEAILLLEALVDAADPVLAVRAGIALSRTHRLVGDLALALQVGDRLAPRLRATGLDRTDEGVQLAMTVVMAHVEMGNLSRAARICREAVAVAEELATPVARSSAYWNSSIVHSERGEMTAALDLAGRALALLGEGADSRNLAWLRLELGRLQLIQDVPDPRAALDHVQRGRDALAWSSASAADIARADVMLAETLLHDGRPEAAVELAARARAALPADLALAHAEASIVLGEALRACGRDEDAPIAFDAAMNALDRIDGHDRLAAQLWYELADLLEAAGDLEGTRRALRGAGAASGLRRRVRAATPERTLDRMPQDALAVR